MSVHVQPESVFTLNRNECSGWAGIRTLGMYALGVSDIAVRWATDAPERPDLRPDQYPILKSFYRGSDPARTTRYKTEMYDMLRKLEEINRTIRAYAKEGRREEAKALYEENAKRLESLPVLRKGAKKASQARKQIDDIYQHLNPILKKAVEKAYL